MEIDSNFKKDIPEESVPYGLQVSNEYFKKIVETKKIYQLSILVIISFLTSYTPYGRLVNSWIGDMNEILKPIVGALFFIAPITISFVFIFFKQRALLFKRVTIKLYKKSWFYALCIIGVLLFVLLGVTSISSYQPNSNPIYGSGYLSVLLKLPGMAIQLIGENLMFVSFLLFGYKTIQNVLSRSSILLGYSFLFAGLCFGLLHLPTYNFDWMQCVFVIGIPAISQMIFFVRFQNVHLGYLMHLNYDLLIIAIALVGAILSS
ncbi:hypothetical protein COE50_06220 [Bacillus anthracis]|nr:hypothetical protein COE50_06220 [Bacillus anthracis]